MRGFGAGAYCRLLIAAARAGRSALDDAKKRNKIPFNPFENVEAPPIRKARVESLSEEQCTRLLTAINGDPLPLVHAH